MGLMNFLGKAVKIGGRIAKKIINGGGRIVKGFGNVIRKLPQGIEIAKKYTPKLIDTFRNVVDLMPNGRAKDKMKEFSDKGENIANKGISKAEEINNKINTFQERLNGTWAGGPAPPPPGSGPAVTIPTRGQMM